ARRAPDHRVYHRHRARDPRGRVAHARCEPSRGRGASQDGARGRAARGPRLRDSGRRESARARGAAPPHQRRSGARARGCDARCRVAGDPRQDRSAHGVILPTRRALWSAAAVSLLGLLAFWVPGSLDAMLVADLALVVAIWIDATRAVRPGTRDLAVEREAPPAFSVGRTGEVGYRWVNRSGRRVQLRAREIRPDLLGGLQPARTVAVARRDETRERLPVQPVRRGRTREGRGGGAFVIDSRGPLGLGARREWVAVPWDVVVYPPLVSARLRASVAEARRRREPGVTPVRRLGEGRLFESLREWVSGDDVRNIDWKATARRGKVIARQYEAERRQQVLLVLDTGRLLSGEIGGVARLDYVVQAALELAYAAV